MHTTAYYIINGITLYRVITAPLMVVLLYLGQIDIFKWMLPVSFFTDAIDGFLARKYRVNSVFGARLDSLGDDLTVLAGLVGILVWKPGFLLDHKYELLALFVLFIIQVILAFRKYGKSTSFHTYFAKLAAVCQGVFLILFFLVPDLSEYFYYTAIIVTGIDLVEEIIIVLILPEWRANVRGLYWVFRTKDKLLGPDQHPS
jgi:CDP-diacylglycerol--glycerol-3-phosphate 3-phosphatidyltransferase